MEAKKPGLILEEGPSKGGDSAAKWKNHTFVKPEKKLLTQEILNEFPRKKIYNYLMIFITELQSSVLRKSISSTKHVEKLEPLVKLLDSLEGLISEAPPLQQPMRFGNKAFKTWHAKAVEAGDKFFEGFLPEYLRGAKVELLEYFADSFGSEARIDYGTGHELAFVIMLFCLNELELVGRAEYEQLVHHVFVRYIKLMRKLQTTYWLEPAGSHGVWGLDDYHFLPFLFGAAELIDNEVVEKPSAIHDSVILNEFAEDYLYLGCIKFIKEAKKGAAFGECAPMLNDISAAASWNKVAAGMIKMFQAEVLGKHPVAKHMFFGSLFKLE